MWTRSRLCPESYDSPYRLYAVPAGSQCSLVIYGWGVTVSYSYSLDCLIIRGVNVFHFRISISSGICEFVARLGIFEKIQKFIKLCFHISQDCINPFLREKSFPFKRIYPDIFNSDLKNAFLHQGEKLKQFSLPRLNPCSFRFNTLCLPCSLFFISIFQEEHELQGVSNLASLKALMLGIF